MPAWLADRVYYFLYIGGGTFAAFAAALIHWWVRAKRKRVEKEEPTDFDDVGLREMYEHGTLTKEEYEAIAGRARRRT